MRAHRPFLLLALLLCACSDYAVDTSELSAESESAEILLTDGNTAELLATITADGEAMDARPGSFLRFTVFAVLEAGSPLLTAAAQEATAESGVGSTVFLELEVEDPLARCSDPEAEGPPVTAERDGGCSASVPIVLGVAGGDVTLQVDAQVVLSFGGSDAPGTVDVRFDG